MENMAFDFWNFFGGLIAGGIGGGILTFKFMKNQRTNGSGTTVDQSKSSAGGDIVGRDKRG